MAGLRPTHAQRALTRCLKLVNAHLGKLNSDGKLDAARLIEAFAIEMGRGGERVRFVVGKAAEVDKPERMMEHDDEPDVADVAMQREQQLIRQQSDRREIERSEMMALGEKLSAATSPPWLANTLMNAPVFSSQSRISPLQSPLATPYSGETASERTLSR